jgi:hypothetical protein
MRPYNLIFMVVILFCAPGWLPASPGLLSRFGAAVTPDRAWTHYPRPEMRRQRWTSLNGLWQYAITPKAATEPTHWQGRILVPFAVQSKLSGVNRTVSPQQRLWYRTSFVAPELSGGEQLLLHFGGAMYRTHIFLNGKNIGLHNGDFSHFTFNITSDLLAGKQKLVVSCWNPANRGTEPCGKQQMGRPGFTMHLPSTGIWQTVWLEKVPAQSIRHLRITPHLDKKLVTVVVRGRGNMAGCDFAIQALADNRLVAVADGEPGKVLTLPIVRPVAWSPSHPFLYTLKVVLRHDHHTIDRVTSYFAMRKITVQKAPDGYMRIFLNGKPDFLFGPLEEGYWPDGAYTPPSNAAMVFDIQAIKRLGFNMCRKHQIVAPQRWYYLCDKLGLMVWQDMPAAFGDVSPPAKAEFKRELGTMIRQLHNEPCVVIWCVFNEGWGQHDTNALLRWVHQEDPLRLVDGPSGWTDKGYGAMKDAHIYPGPGMWPAMATRASVLGESGRFPCPIGGHIWPYPGGAYQRNVPLAGSRASDETRAAWLARYKRWAIALEPLIRRGLAAAVYTRFADQITDHCTGLITCDRKIFKAKVSDIRALNSTVRLGAASAAAARRGEGRDSKGDKIVVTH